MTIRDGLRVESEQIHSFLMIGQSNMAGRGEFSDVTPIENKACYMLRMGRWQRMREPINPDRGIFEGEFHSGVSLGASFADEAAKAWQTRIGLIPCADGGTCIDQWAQGEILYDHAVMMTRLAMRSSVFSGILWHQGEGDCNNDEQIAAYKPKLLAMMRALRRDLNAEHLPLILGELSEVTSERWSIAGREHRINAILHEVAAELPNCAVVSSKELTLKPDGLHFDAVSLRVFGKRYFEAVDKIRKEQRT